MTTPISRWAGGAFGAVLVGYLFLLPLFRPDPWVEVEVPERAALGNDVNIRVDVHAWQGGVRVSQVRFYVDYYASTAKGSEGLFYPEQLLNQRADVPHSIPIARRLTWPRTEALRLTVPLKRHAETGLLGKGVLEGKVDVTINYIRPGRRHIGSQPNVVTRTLAVPFRMAIE